MTYSEFLAHHPELDGLDEQTRDIAYAQYLEQLNDALASLEED